MSSRTLSAGSQQHDPSSSSTVADQKQLVDPFYGLKAADVEQWDAPTIASEGFENNGAVYKDIFDALQLRPERQAEYYVLNFAPGLRLMFKKPGGRTFHNALFKCDEAAKKRLTVRFLLSLGKITWQRERSWVLSKDKLPLGVEPLQYLSSKSELFEGCHDRFYDILDPMWTRMRQIRLKIKQGVWNRRQNALLEEQASGPPSNSGESRFPPSSTVSRPKRPRKGTSLKTSAPDEDTDVDETHHWPDTILTNTLFKDFQELPDEIDELEAEEAVQIVLQRLVEIKERCPPRLFMRVCARNSARLDEIEVFHQQEAEYAHEEASTHTDLDDDTEMTDSRTLDSMPDASSEFFGDAATSRLREISDPTFASLPSALIQPALPSTVMTYIAKYGQTDSFIQPYMWLDAPTRENTYTAFRHGLIVRSEIPESANLTKLTILICYEWNKFCRTLRNESDWKNLFIPDLIAAAKRKVEIWRMRACCITE